MAKQFYEEGGYIGTIIEQGFGESKDKGTPFFFLRIKIEEFDSGQTLSKQYERTVTRYITEKTIPFLAEDLELLGFTWRNSFNDLNPKNPNYHSFVGTRVPVYCQHEGDYERWNLSRPQSEYAVKELQPSKMRELDNLFGRSMKQSIGGHAQPRQQPQPIVATAEDISDDDIPF